MKRGITVMAVVAWISLLAVNMSSAQSWLDPNWKYRLPVAVSSPCESDVTDYQVKVTLDGTFAFDKSQADGSDLRVTGSDKVTKIPFWIENWDATGTSASIWVKVPSIPSGGTTIYLYYGNTDSPGPQLVEVPPIGPWAKIAGNPIKPIGDPAALDGSNLLSENIVYDETTGRYWMVFANYRNSSVGLVWSTNPGDPASWNWHGDVISSANAPHITKYGGIWHIFYSHGAWPFGIYVSTSASITGPYSAPTLVLDHGTGWQTTAADWEAARVDEPYVFQRADGKWILVYMGDRTGYASGCDGCTGPTEQVGYAIAENILGPYEKYEGNPILRFGPTGTFDAGTIADPWVVEFHGTYYIGYTVSATKSSPWRTAYATTTNWENFTKGGVTLDWGSAGAWDQCDAFRGAVTRIGDTYFFPYTGHYCGTPPAGQPTGYIMGIATQPTFTEEKLNTCDGVFEFCDNFDVDGDMSKWVSASVGADNTLNVSGGILSMTAQAAAVNGYVQMRGNKLIGTGTLLETYGRHSGSGTSCDVDLGTSNPGGGSIPGDATDNAGELGYKQADMSFSQNLIRIMDFPLKSGYTIHSSAAGSTPPTSGYRATNLPFSTGWEEYLVYRDTSGNARFWVGGTESSTVLSSPQVPTADLYPWLMSYAEPCGPRSSTFDVDWIRVRNWCGTDASAIAGAEEAFNIAPVANDQSLSTNEDTTVAITLIASDANGNLLSYDIVPPPSSGFLSGSAPALTYTPGENFNGVDSFTFTANDGTADSNTATVTITVNPVNDAPVLTAIGNKTLDEMTMLSFAATATDVDAPPDSLIFSLTGPLVGASIHHTSGAFTWTPTEGQGPGNYTFDVCVSDGALGDCETITITVSEVNRAPVLDPIGNKTVSEEATLAFNATASDPDVPGNTLSFSLVGAPAGASISGTGAFTWMPTEEQGPNSYQLKVKVCDNGSPSLCDEEEITFEVKEANRAPELASIGNQQIQWGDTLTFTATASDSDLPPNALTFSLEEPPAGASIDATTGVFTWQPASAQIGMHTIVVRVTDNGMPPASDHEAITATVAQRLTTLTYTGATSGQYSDEVELSASLTDSSTGSGSGTPIPDKTVGFVLGSQTASGTTDSGGVATVRLQLDQPKGISYPVTASFTGDSYHIGSTGEATFTIDPEDAYYEFAEENPVAVKVTGAGSDSSVPFSITVDISEAQPDLPEGLAQFGDITHIGLADVTMTLQPVGPGTAVNPTGECRLGDVTGSGYLSTLPITCDFLGAPVNTYTVQVDVSGAYYDCYGEDVLVVYDPSLGFATGGGWFYWPETRIGNPGEENYYPGDKTNFGFTMNYGKKGTNVKGSLLLIRHMEDGSIYRIKSNALNGLALGEDRTVPMGWASFSGKATYLEPGWFVPVGNHTFMAYVEDRNDPGNGVDTFWIRVYDQNRIVVDEISLPLPGATNAFPIERGNIVVPHRAR
jgi:hypothetical protein